MYTRFFVFLFALFELNCSGQKVPMYDSYGGIKSLPGQKTGWFHVEEIKGRWYFITPEGNAFFSLGATHAVETIKQDELKLFETKYKGSEEELSKFYLKCFQEWGYNSSGYGATPTMEKHIPYVVEVWTIGPRSHSAGAKSVNYDIFDPKVQERLRQTIFDSTKRHINNPNCLGYVFSDCVLWGVIPQSGLSYAGFYRTLEPGSHGKKEYISFLKKLYADDINSFREVYQLDVKSFNDLLNIDFSGVSPVNNQKIASDDEAFLVILADKYFRFVTDEFRKSDPNHLLLGDRFMAATLQQPGLRTPDSILKKAAEYIDVISFQPMGTKSLQRDYIDYVYNLCGKPILFADVNTIQARPSEGQTDTKEYETTAGEFTLQYYSSIAESKSLIGIHRCTVRDYRPWDTRFYRRGLLKGDDTEYPILVDYTKKANAEVYKIVYQLIP